MKTKTKKNNSKQTKNAIVFEQWIGSPKLRQNWPLWLKWLYYTPNPKLRQNCPMRHKWLYYTPWQSMTSQNLCNDDVCCCLTFLSWQTAPPIIPVQYLISCKTSILTLCEKNSGWWPGSANGFTARLTDTLDWTQRSKTMIKMEHQFLWRHYLSLTSNFHVILWLLFLYQFYVQGLTGNYYEPHKPMPTIASQETWFHNKIRYISYHIITPHSKILTTNCLDLYYRVAA